MKNTVVENLFLGTADSLWLLGKEAEPIAWTKIVKLHGVGMLHVAKGVLGDAQLAEDVVQNAFLQIRELSVEYFRRENDKKSKGLFGHGQKENAIFKNDFAARNWILRITYFVAKDMKKSRNSAKGREKIYSQQWEEARQVEPAFNQETVAILQKEVEKLPDELRLPIVLRYHCDMNLDQVSSELGLAVHLIRQRLKKGLEVLQSRISATLGSSLPVVGVESLLSLLVSFKGELPQSLLENCNNLLQSPALLKSQLIQESKFLLLPSITFIKGIAMLKILSLLAGITLTALLAISSIQSKDIAKKNDENKKVTTQEEIVRKGSNEKTVSSSELGKLNEEFGRKTEEAINDHEKILAKTNDIYEILPYLSEKAIFTIIIPDIKKSIDRFLKSTAVNFYTNQSLELLEKLPEYLNSKFQINLGALNGKAIGSICSSFFASIDCMSIQFEANKDDNKTSFFLVGVLNQKSEIEYEKILQILEPYLKENRKTFNKFEGNVYQFEKNQQRIVLIKSGTKVFFGSENGSWFARFENEALSSFWAKKSFVQDIFWNCNAKSLFDKIDMTSFGRDKIVNSYLHDIIGIEYIEDINANISILPKTISHKIDVTLIDGTQRGIFDIVNFKPIKKEMLESISKKQVAFSCLNIDLQKSWLNFVDYMKRCNVKFEEKFRYGQLNPEKDFMQKIEKFNDVVKAIFQLDFNEILNNCFTGEVTCRIEIEPKGARQIFSLRIKDVAIAKKLGNGFAWLKLRMPSLDINIDENAMNFSFLLPSDLINKKFLDLANNFPLNNMNTFEKSQNSFYSWSNSELCRYPSFLLPLLSQINLLREIEPLEYDNNLSLLVGKFFWQNCLKVRNNKNQLTFEMEGSDDLVQLMISQLINYKQFNETVPVIFETTEEKKIYDENDNFLKTEKINIAGYYLNGLKTGHWVSTNQKGEVIEEGDYLNNKETGVWVQSNGIIDIRHQLSKGEMINGLKNGRWVTYYGNQSIQEIGEYIEGDRIGLWKYFHANGALKKEEFYKQRNAIEGEVIRFDDAGFVSASRNYTSGQLNGYLKVFKNGIILNESFYELGNLRSRKSYYETGSLKYECLIDRDLTKEFAISSVKEYYFNAQLKAIRKVSFDKKKYLAGQVAVEMPIGEWLEWYEDGSKKIVGNFDRNGFGMMTAFYKNGNQSVVFNFENGILNGKSEGWYSNGARFFSGNYEENLISGNWVVWYVSGIKKCEGKFKKAIPYPGWKFFEKNGDLKMELNAKLADFLLESNQYNPKIKELAEEFNYLPFDIGYWEEVNLLGHLEEFEKMNSEDSLKSK